MILKLRREPRQSLTPLLPVTTTPKRDAILPGDGEVVSTPREEVLGVLHETPAVSAEVTVDVQTFEDTLVENFMI